MAGCNCHLQPLVYYILIHLVGICSSTSFFHAGTHSPTPLGFIRIASHHPFQYSSRKRAVGGVEWWSVAAVTIPYLLRYGMLISWMDGHVKVPEISLEGGTRYLISAGRVWDGCGTLTFVVICELFFDDSSTNQSPAIYLQQLTIACS